MQFNSYIFVLLFLPVCISGYFLLGRAEKYEAAKLWMIGMSLGFYAYLHVAYCALLAGDILINYGMMHWVRRDKRHKKYLLALGVTLNLGFLLYFKYVNFFLDNINKLFQKEIPFLTILLPVGLSFITFQQISFLVDCYKDTAMQYSFTDYVLYVVFFPKINSGPIIPFRELLVQLQDPERKKANFANISRGCYGFAMGLAKKVLIADTLAKFVTIGFSDIRGLHTASALMVMLCFSLQLYYDFSGYSDMAVGVAYMLNIKLPVNFNSPYKAHSVTEFWKRWHITLTQFFTRYVYIPLGGSRRGLRRTCINIMIVFFLSGLWHGANWTFVVWGCLHGILMAVERAAGERTEKRTERSSVASAAGWLFTFLFANVAWVIFRADTLSDACLFLSRIFHPGWGTMESRLAGAMNEIVEVRVLCRLGLQGTVDRLPCLPVVLFVALVLFFTLTKKNTQEKLEGFCFSGRQMAVTVLLLFWSLISLSGVSVFLYSDF